MRNIRRGLRRRLGQRGAVALEFALSLFFLVPLLLGTLDYGYYFWIGVNAMEAAHAGALAAAQTSGLTGCPAAAVGSALAPGSCGTAPNPLTAKYNACVAVTTQMAHTPLSASYVTLPTNGCLTTPVNPAWQLQVQVDFPPAVGFLNPWMPASSTAGRVRYRSSTVVAGN